MGEAEEDKEKAQSQEKVNENHYLKKWKTIIYFSALLYPSHEGMLVCVCMMCTNIFIYCSCEYLYVHMHTHTYSHMYICIYFFWLCECFHGASFVFL